MTHHKYDTFEEKVLDNQKKSEHISRLQKELENIKNERLEERFCWALSLVILLNVFFFTTIDNWAGALSILFLQLVLFIILARKCGMEDLTDILDKYVLNHPMNPLHRDKNKNKDNP